MCEIQIRLNRQEFQYDVYSLVQAFFPGEQLEAHCVEACPGTACQGEVYPNGGQMVLSVWCADGNVRVDCDRKGQPRIRKEAAIPVGCSRPEMRNRCKQVLYQVLRDATGRTLAWGTLTGIRPVKLAAGFLADGMEPPSVQEHMGQAYYLSKEKSSLCVEIALREGELLRGLDYRDGYSLYVGIPFCPSICMYCSFSSNPLGKWGRQVDTYVEALCREIRAVGRLMQGKKLCTVYMGGGTPTTLEPAQMERVLASLEESFPFGGLWEFTVEAGRPDSITKEKLQVLKRHPVTRISVNPQTMNQKTLDFIGRKHTAEDTRRAYWMARGMGFGNINMDLIVGLPGEGIREVEETLAQVRQMYPDSLTVHSLAVKRAARLRLFTEEHRGISFENSGRIMAMAERGARDMGMVPYYLYRQKNMAGNQENVGYAKPGKLGIYNIFMMEEKQTIVACGAGSASKRVYPDGRVERSENVKDVASFIERVDEMIERKRRLLTDF